jgi:hypothetical protein
MTSLESVVLPLKESRELVEHGIVLDTVVSWITDGATHSRPVIVEPAVYEAVKSRIICPAPVLSEMTTWLMCHDCNDITFTNETADGEIAVGARCNNSEGRDFEAHEADELQAAAALLMEVSK